VISLHPRPDPFHRCPYCQILLQVNGWYIPGVRNLAELQCPQCGLEFYGDLPVGHGLHYPMLLERSTGIVHNAYHVDWFADALGDSYARRINSPIGFSAENFRPLCRVVLLNCLDAMYGHCLLKLLNAQYYLDHHPNLDLVVLIPRFLRWMVPEGVAGIWMVDLPLKRGSEWNDWLAGEIKRQIEPLDKCWLSVALSHPHPADYNIERFTRVHPFPVTEWEKRLEKPAITFIWREDRIWKNTRQHRCFQKLVQPIIRRLGLIDTHINKQQQQVIMLSQSLRQDFLNLDFAVVGLGCPGGLPDWINDLRRLEIDQQVEQAWCERYANSHIVIGVHGSNMLLPSAHAGAVVELVPLDRWDNLIQDILRVEEDNRTTLYQHKFLPLDASPAIVAIVVGSLLRYFPIAMLNFDPRWRDHKILQSDPTLIAKKRREIVERLTNL